jgi:hypothetical protein
MLMIAHSLGRHLPYRPLTEGPRAARRNRQNQQKSAERGVDVWRFSNELILVRQIAKSGQNASVTLAIVIIVLVVLIALLVGFIVFRTKRRAGGVVATSSRRRSRK